MDNKLSLDDDDDDDDDDEDDDDDDDDDDEDEDEIIRHPTLYFVRLDPDISEDEIEDLLDDLNSEEVWFREEINLRLWNTVMFPYTSMGGESVTNIDGQIGRAKKRAKLNDVEFNIGSILKDPLASQNLFCFEEANELAPPGDSSVKIAIFDSGIDENAISSSGSNILDYTGYDYVDDDEIPDDQNGHGTQIAALIHHLINKDQEAPNITFDIRKTHDNQGVGYLSNLIPAILDAVDEGAGILNFSFSYQDENTDTKDRPLRLAIDYAEQNGVLMIAAAGNTNKNNDMDNIISFPASYPNANIISVAALSCENKLSGFSSYGQNTVDVAYLGEHIPTISLNGSQVDKSGTSYTTAYITAMAAIMASYDIADANAIKCSLIQTSTYSDDLKDLVASQGILNFSTALENMGSCN
jgi:subtilisin family serine protease